MAALDGRWCRRPGRAGPPGHPGSGLSRGLGPRTPAGVGGD